MKWLRDWYRLVLMMLIVLGSVFWAFQTLFGAKTGAMLLAGLVLIVALILWLLARKNLFRIRIHD